MFIEIPASKKSMERRKAVFGVGTNDANYQAKVTVNGKQITCPFYKKWINMLRRCYSEKSLESRPTYIGCTVTAEWLFFSNFRRWMNTQDWEGYHLDKDLLIQGNKVYSPLSCLFVPRDINNLLNDHGAKRGLHPLGVTFDNRYGRYQAKVNNNGKREHLGLFDTPKDAHKAYLKNKATIILALALQQNDVRLKKALIRISDEFKVKYNNV